MYKQYLNDYEKRADEIRKAAKAVEKGTQDVPCQNISVPVKCEKEEKQPVKQKTQKVFGNMSIDDLLILGLILLLFNSEKRDNTLLIILGYLFFTGL